MTSTQRLRELLAAATPGPWERLESWPWRVRVVSSSGAGHVATLCDAAYRNALDKQRSLDDAALIVAMRNELPALLDRLDEAERLLRGVGLPGGDKEATTLAAIDAFLAKTEGA